MLFLGFLFFTYPDAKATSKQRTSESHYNLFLGKHVKFMGSLGLAKLECHYLI